MLRRSGLQQRLEGFADFRFHEGSPPGPREFLAEVGAADAILLGSNLPDLVLREAPNLKMISFTGLGASNFVNLSVARERRIAVGVTPAYGDQSVSEHALALLFAVARRVVQGHELVNANGWRPMVPGVQLSGKTAGVVGFGGIGERTAMLFHAVGMNVLAWTRTPPTSPPPGVRFVGLEELFDSVDVLSLHLALNEKTHGIITGNMLDRLKPDAIVINTARAELIAHGELERRLQAGVLSAGLDVFTSEPLEPASVLRGLPNVVLSPHQGYNTPDALHALLTLAVDNIENFLTGTDFHQV